MSVFQKRFSDDSGELDIKKLLETNPDFLTNFIHKAEGQSNGEGSAQGEDGVSMSFAVGTAALRQALGLSDSYAPLNAQSLVRDMAASAQQALGLEGPQGLQMSPGSSSTPSDDDK